MAEPRERSLQIGAIAAAAGMTPDAVRYYERLGLLPAPARTSGRFRTYSADTLSRLRFIQQAKRLGLRLQDIRELLTPARGRPRDQCAHVRALLARHLADVEARLRELKDFRRTLEDALSQCDRALRTNGRIGCPVVDQLGETR